MAKEKPEASIEINQGAGKKTVVNKTTNIPEEPSDLVIKEIMVQKNVGREEAINILKNPTK